MSEARIDRLEAGLARVEQVIIRIEAGPAATLPRLATGAELADKPSWGYNWGIRATMIAAYTAALAADAMGAVVLTE